MGASIDMIMPRSNSGSVVLAIFFSKQMNFSQPGAIVVYLLQRCSKVPRKRRRFEKLMS